MPSHIALIYYYSRQRKGRDRGFRKNLGTYPRGSVRGVGWHLEIQGLRLMFLAFYALLVLELFFSAPSTSADSLTRKSVLVQ